MQIANILDLFPPCVWTSGWPHLNLNIFATPWILLDAAAPHHTLPAFGPVCLGCYSYGCAWHLCRMHISYHLNSYSLNENACFSLPWLLSKTQSQSIFLLRPLNFLLSQAALWLNTLIYPHACTHFLWSLPGLLIAYFILWDELRIIDDIILYAVKVIMKYETKCNKSLIVAVKRIYMCLHILDAYMNIYMPTYIHFLYIFL